VNKPGATITLNAAKTLTGALTLTSGTLASGNLGLSVSGDWTNNSGSSAFTAGTAAVTFNGTAAQTIGGSATTSFNNLTITNTSAAVSVNTNINVSGTLNMSGAATVLSPAATTVINSGGATGTISGSGTIQVTTITGTPDYVNQYLFSTNTLTSMTVNYAGVGAQTIDGTSTAGNYGTLATSGSGTKTLDGAVTVNTGITIGSGTTLDVSTSNYQITDGGSWANNSGTFNSEAGTVLFNANTSGKTLTGSMIASAGNDFYNLTFNGSGGAWSFAANNADVTNNLTITAGTVTAPSTTLQVAGNYSNGGIFTNNSGTVNFNGTSGQSIGGSSSTTFYKLTNSNTGDTVTAGAAVSVSNTLTTVSGSVMDMATYVLGGTLTTVSNSGTIMTEVPTTTSATPIVSGKTWGGTIIYGATSGAQTIVAGTYNNLTLNNTSGTNTAAGSLTVNGALTTTSGGTLDMTASYTLAGSLGTITNNGSIKTEVLTATSANPIPSGKTWGGTIVYNGAGAQTLVTGTFNNITLSGARASTAITLASGTITMSGDFIVTYTGTPTFTTTGNTFVYSSTTSGQTVGGITYLNLTLDNSSGIDSAGGAITVNGALTTTSGGALDMITYVLGGTMTTVTNNGTIQTEATGATPIASGKTWAGTIIYGAAAGSQTVVAATYNNLTLNNTSGTNTAGGNLTVNGTLTTTSGGTLDMTASYTLGGTLNTINNNGTIQTEVLTATSATPIASGKTWSGTGMVAYNGAGAQTMVTGNYYDIKLSGARASTAVTLASGTISLSNDFLVTYTGTPTFTTTGNTFVYTSTTSGQTVGGITYLNLTLDNSSGIDSTGGAVTVNGTLTTTSGGALDMITYVLGGSGTFTNNGTIQTEVPTSTSTTPIPSGKTWAGTIIYGATAGSQTVVAGTYNNLTIGNTSGTNTAGGVLTVNGALTTTAGGTLNMVTYAIAGATATVSNSGTIETQSLTNPAITAGDTWGGTINYNATTGTQHIPVGTYNNLTFSNTSGTDTATGVLTVNGTLTTTAGGTLDMVTYAIAGATASISNGGTIETQSLTNPAITSGDTWGGTIYYNAATGGQYIPAGTYNNLTFSSSSGTETATGVLTVNNILAITSGCTLNMVTYAIAGSLSTIVNGGTIQTQSLTNPAIISGGTWGGTINYNATSGGQYVPAGTYNNLTFGNSSGTQTATGVLTVNGVLTTTAGGTLDMATYAIAGATSSISNGGTIQTESLTNPAITSGDTWGGVINYNATTGSQYVPAGTYNNLTFSNTSGADTAVGSLTVNGTLTTTSGGTLDMSATYILSGTLGTISNSGTIQTEVLTTTNATPVASGKNWGSSGTITYSGAGAQTIVTGTYNALTTATSGTKTLAGAITTNSDITIGSGTTLDVSTSNYQVNAGGNWTNNGTFTSENGVVYMTGTATGLTLSGSMTGSNKFYNLVFLGGSTAAWSFGANDAEVGNTFNISTGTVTAPSDTLIVHGNWYNGATFSNNNGTVLFSQTFSGLVINGTLTGTSKFNNIAFTGSAGAWSFSTSADVGGNFTLGSGTTVTAPSGTLQVAGNWINGGTFTHNSGTVNLYGTSAQSTSGSATTFYNLTNSNTGGTVTAGAAITVNGTLTTVTGSKLDMSTYLLSGTLSTISNSGTIQTEVPTSTSATPVPTGKTWGGTITYGATTGSQTVVAATYNNLALNNTSGTNSAGGSLTVNGTLTTTSGGTMDMTSSYTLGGTLSSISNGGIIKTEVLTTTNATPIASGKTWNGIGAIVYNGAGAQTIVTGTYNVLTTSTSGISGTRTLAGAIVADSIITIGSGTTLDVSTSNYQITAYDNWINNGTFNAEGGTVLFNATGAESISGSAATAFNNVTVSSVTKLTLNTSGQTIKGVLKCNDTLNAGGDLTLLSTSTQTALIDGTGTGAVLGNVIMQRYIDSSYGYKYVSSPFTSATVGGFSSYVSLTDTVFPQFYSYNENLASDGWVIDTASSHTLTPLNGYAGNFGTTLSGKTLSLTGVVNNGSISATFYNHNQTYTTGYNLAGNPYPEPIDWNASSGWTKTNIDNAIYYFNASDTNQYTGTYDSYVSGVSSDGRATNIIASMQGFFIHVSTGSYPVTGTLATTNSVRVNNLSPVFHRQSSVQAWPLLRLTAGFSGGAYSDPVVIYFDDTVAAGPFDKNLDALKLMNTAVNVPNLYAIAPDTTTLSIQALPSLGDTTYIVPLGLATMQDGQVTFNAKNIDNVPSGTHIWFYDTQTGMSQDLTTNPTYTVNIGAGKNNNRFFLMFTTHDKINIPGFNGELNAYVSGKTLYVYNTVGNGTLIITNMLGQVIDKQELNGNGYHQEQLNVVSGVYIVTLYSEMGKQSKKLFIGSE